MRLPFRIHSQKLIAMKKILVLITACVIGFSGAEATAANKADRSSMAVFKKDDEQKALKKRKKSLNKRAKDLKQEEKTLRKTIKLNRKERRLNKKDKKLQKKEQKSAK